MGKGGCAVLNCIPSKLDGRHRFPDPKKWPDMFSLWLQIINNNKLNEMAPDVIFKNSRVCSKHFTLIDFGANHKLNRNARPSLHVHQHDVTRRVKQEIDLPTAAPCMQREHCCLAQQSFHEENVRLTSQYILLQPEDSSNFVSGQKAPDIQIWYMSNMTSRAFCLVCGFSDMDGEVKQMHYFPKNLKKSKVWQENMKMKYCGDSLRNYRICSRHFEENNYVGVRLGRYAVPTRFPCNFIEERSSVSGSSSGDGKIIIDEVRPTNVCTQQQDEDDTEYAFIAQHDVPRKCNSREEGDPSTLGTSSEIETPNSPSSDEIITRPTPTRRTYGRINESG